MPRRTPTPGTVQDVLDYYFPMANWDRIGIEIVASCVRCSGLVKQQHFNNHIQWHTNALG